MKIPDLVARLISEEVISESSHSQAVLDFLRQAGEEVYAHEGRGEGLKPKRLYAILKRHAERIRQELGLEPIAELGSRVAYDPELHVCHEPIKAGDMAMVVKTGWSAGGRVVEKAELVRRM